MVRFITLTIFAAACGKETGANDLAPRRGATDASVQPTPVRDVGALPEVSTPATFCAAFHRPSFPSCSEAEREDPRIAMLVHSLERVVEGCSEALASSVAKGRVRFDAGEAQRCVAARATSRDPRAVNVVACERVTIGLSGEGQPCDAPIDCARGFVCKESRCVPPAALGEKCEPLAEMSRGTALMLDFGGHLPCMAGTHCHGLQQLCVTDVPSGGACTLFECGVGFRCQDRVCVEARAGALGARCSADIDCEIGMYCGGLLPAEADDGGAPRCTAKRSAGAACLTDRQCRGTCKAGRCAGWCGSER